MMAGKIVAEADREEEVISIGIRVYTIIAGIIVMIEEELGRDNVNQVVVDMPISSAIFAN